MIFFAILLVIVGTMTGCSSNSERQMKKFPSPDKRWIVEVDAFDRGMAPAFAAVELYPSSGRRTKNDDVFMVHGAHEISVEWKGNTLVHISCLDCPYQDATLLVAKKGPVWFSYEGVRGVYQLEYP